MLLISIAAINSSNFSIRITTSISCPKPNTRYSHYKFYFKSNSALWVLHNKRKVTFIFCLGARLRGCRDRWNNIPCLLSLGTRLRWGVALLSGRLTPRGIERDRSYLLSRWLVGSGSGLYTILIKGKILPMSEFVK
jgi:hypothetical protein